MDNSITWKEEIIWGVELLISFGHFRAKGRNSAGLYQTYQIGTNPYRFDKMGFDDKTFHLFHLHQCILYLFIGLIVSWISFSNEVYYFIQLQKPLLPFQWKIRQKL